MGIKFVPPDVVERQYRKYLNLYATTYVRLVRAHLKELIPELRETASTEKPEEITKIRMDVNVEERIRKLLELAAEQLDALFPVSKLRKWALAMIGGVNRGSKKNIQKSLRTGYKNKKEVPNFEPLMRDGELTPYFQNLVDENVGLIKSIPQEKTAAFKNELVLLITQDANRKTIQEAIDKYVTHAKGKPSVIARDQIGKLNGQLNEYRQKQLGGKRYRWRTAKDSRVAGNPSGRYPKAKPSHWHRDGKVYLWANPPKGGHPGQRVQCRCWAEMILDDILEVK